MILRSRDGSSQECSSNTLISELSVAYEMMACRMKNKVQMLGIHVLKTYSQRELTEGPQTKTHSFMMIFGELLGNVFSVMQATLKKCSSKESVNMIDECLKLLFLFHTLSQSKKYQQDATILLLDALMIVCYLSSDSGSQEELAPSSHVADIRDGSMSGNVISTSEAEGHPDNVDTSPESFEGESAVS